MSMKVVVFGAGGFIGGWLCEELASCQGVDIFAGVRQWASAVRLARRGFKIFQVDLEGVTADLSVLAGADVVVNASVPPPRREPELAFRLYSACGVARVRKFVQLSSVAVYGDRTGSVDEDSPPAPSSDYAWAKLDMENRLLAAAASSGPQLSILRPSIVYGPYSENWTVRYARRIAKFRWRSLGPAGAGTCNLVHGRDVAKSIIAAARTEVGSRPHILNINGPELITWNEYIDLFGEALEIHNRFSPNPILFDLKSSTVDIIRTAGSWVKQHGMKQHFDSAPMLVDNIQSVVDLYPPPEEFRLLRRKVKYSWSRAGDVIGFNPSISLEEGLRESAQWCRLHGVVS
jgi:nucleoside-diphosphate-sugar epimerase